MFGGSKKFFRLNREQEVRDLTASEQNFLDAYGEDHSELAEEWESERLAMNFLRGQVIQHEPSEGFETKILRQHRVSAVKHSISYWSPAIVGGSIAAIAALAILQVLVHSRETRATFKPGESEARNSSQPLAFPSNSAIPR